MYNSLIVLGTLSGTILVILTMLTIKYFRWNEIFLQVEPSLKSGSNIGANEQIKWTSYYLLVLKRNCHGP